MKNPWIEYCPIHDNARNYYYDNEFPYGDNDYIFMPVTAENTADRFVNRFE